MVLGIDTGILLGIIGIGAAIGGIIVGTIIAWIFYRKHQHGIEILETLFLAGVQIQDDSQARRGKILRKPDGTYSVLWEVKLEETMTASATAQAKNPAN